MGINDALGQRRRGVPLDPPVVIIFAAHANLKGLGRRARSQALDLRGNGGQIILVDHVQVLRCQHLLFAVTERIAKRRVYTLEVAVEAGDAEQVKGEREEAVDLVTSPFSLDDPPQLRADAGHQVE